MLPLFTSYINTLLLRHFSLRETMCMYCSFSALAYYCWGIKSMSLSFIIYTRYHLRFDIGGEIKREWRILADKYNSFITCQPWFSLLTYEQANGFLRVLPLKMKAICSSEIMRTSDSASEHKPEEMNPQCQSCGNLISLYLLLCYISWPCEMSKKCEGEVDLTLCVVWSVRVILAVI
jgi:hypothetical protein